MLKDEASLSREKMSKTNLIEIINSVVEDFKQDLINQNKKIEIIIRMEQVLRMDIIFLE